MVRWGDDNLKLCYDHATIIVPDCVAAGKSFERLGFRVVDGVVPSKAIVARKVISFPDETYIELIQVHRVMNWISFATYYVPQIIPYIVSNPYQQRIMRQYTGLFGLTDCCLKVNEDLSVEEIQKQFEKRSEPVKADIVEVKNEAIKFDFSLIIPDSQDDKVVLPVIFKDKTEAAHEARVPHHAKGHKNNVTSFKGVGIAVNCMESAKKEFDRLFGVNGGDRGFSTKYRLDNDSFVMLEQARKWKGSSGAALVRSGGNTGYFRIYLEYEGRKAPKIDTNDPIWDYVSIEFIKSN
eukprot:Nk52_evm56s236 gene=Nk52_evmTU56s236